ncbi:MAG: lysostaphin resistance A-like protein [Dehalococcoidia bacterium]
MLIGAGAFVLMFFTINAIVAIWAINHDDFSTEDVGNAFERMQEVGHYGVERLDAAVRGLELPEAPIILAKQRDLQFTLLVTMLSQAVLLGIVLYATRQKVSGFIRAAGLNRIQLWRLWMIFGIVLLVYAALFLYSLAAEAIGISWLEPSSTVPSGVIRDDLTLSITGLVALIGAPISEECFFRGLVFSGLLRWGFWPAALISGTAFSMVHFDPGSLLPFIGIGVVLAWVYWRRGSLWDSIAFHFMFNATSFALLVASR